MQPKNLGQNFFVSIYPTIKLIHNLIMSINNNFRINIKVFNNLENLRHIFCIPLSKLTKYNVKKDQMNNQIRLHYAQSFNKIIL